MVFSPFTPPPPTPPKFINVTALHQLETGIFLLYLHEANDLILNSEQTRQTCLPKSRPGQDAAIFVLINDRDFDNEIPIFYPSPLQLTHTLLVSLLYFL